MKGTVLNFIITIIVTMSLVSGCGGGGSNDSSVAGNIETKTVPAQTSPLITTLTFNDLGFQNCVNAQANKNNWTQVHQITTLSCSYMSIRNIDGIENLTSLKELDLSKNKLTDINKLSTLVTLEKLYLNGNNFSPSNISNIKKSYLNNSTIGIKLITDLAPIENLTNLTELTTYVIPNTNNVNALSQLVNLNRLKIKIIYSDSVDVSFLANYKALQYLSVISEITLKDITSIKNLTELTYLDIQNTDIKEIGTLTNSKKLSFLCLPYSLETAGTLDFPLLETLITSTNQVELDTLVNLNQIKTLHLLSDPTNDTLAKFTSLKHLILGLGVHVDNIKLSPDLESLVIQKSNGIESTAPLSGLSNLKKLNMSGASYLKDLDGIEKLINLEELNINNSQISDISSLSSLTKLKSLSISSTGVSDLSPIANLTKLEELALWQARVSDIEALSQLKQLNYLDLDSNKVSNIDALQHLTKLQFLDLYANKVSDIDTLKNLTNLNYLVLSDNKINDITSISTLDKLTHLYLDLNKLNSIDPLKNLNQLQRLSASVTNISDISVLNNKTSLVHLWLGSNNISDINSLHSLTKLQSLALNSNSISDIAPLANLTMLNILQLGDNKISDLTPLKNLNLIDWLNLESNNITSVNELSELESLRSLSIANNPNLSCDLIKLLEKTVNIRANCPIDFIE